MTYGFERNISLLLQFHNFGSIKTASLTCLPYRNTLIRKLFRAHCTQSNEIVINSIVVAVCYEMFYVYKYMTQTHLVLLYLWGAQISSIYCTGPEKRESMYYMPIN